MLNEVNNLLSFKLSSAVNEEYSNLVNSAALDRRKFDSQVDQGTSENIRLALTIESILTN